MTTLQNQRTKKIIFMGFQELLLQKQFSKMTINEIANKSMIHRSTFYIHFNDKYDLLEQFLKDKSSTSHLQVTEIYQHPYTTFANIGNEQLLPIFKYQAHDQEFRNTLFQFIMNFIMDAPSEKTELEKYFFIGRFKAINMWVEQTHQPYDAFVDYQQLDKIFKTGKVG